MGFENKDGEGALFRNKDKKEGDNLPNMTGRIRDLNGQELQIAAWSRVAKSGERYQFIKISEPREEQQDQGRRPDPPDFDDDIPF